MPIYAYKNEWKKRILNLGLCKVLLVSSLHQSVGAFVAVHFI